MLRSLEVTRALERKQGDGKNDAMFGFDPPADFLADMPGSAPLHNGCDSPAGHLGSRIGHGCGQFFDGDYH